MAHTHDWITLDEGKVAIDATLTDTSNDILIASIITALSTKLDDQAGPAVARTVTDEVHSGGVCTIELRRGPIQSISSLREYRPGDTFTTLSAQVPGSTPHDAYFARQYKPQAELNLLSGLIERTVNGQKAQFWPGRGNVIVTYLAGRWASTSAVDERFKAGAKVCLKNWWRQYEVGQAENPTNEFSQPQQNFPRFAIPVATKMLLSDVWQPGVGFGA